MLAIVAPAAPAAAQTIEAHARSELRLDHIPIAVRTLDSAEQTYRALGFTLKPGRAHANGIRNTFIKFPSGDYLELISPESGPVDGQSARYVTFLNRHEGGAALALHATSLERVATLLREAGHAATTQRGAAFSTMALEDEALQWLFFIEYVLPVNDPPELLEHENTALGIASVWINGKSYEAIDRLSAILPLRGSVRWAAESTGAGQPIVGVTLRVRCLVEARRAVQHGTGLDLPIRLDERGSSVMIPAANAHGLWIELLQPTMVPSGVDSPG